MHGEEKEKEKVAVDRGDEVQVKGSGEGRKSAQVLEVNVDNGTGGVVGGDGNDRNEDKGDARGRDDKDPPAPSMEKGNDASVAKSNQFGVTANNVTDDDDTKSAIIRHTNRSAGNGAEREDLSGERRGGDEDVSLEKSQEICHEEKENVQEGERPSAPTTTATATTDVGVSAPTRTATTSVTEGESDTTTTQTPSSSTTTEEQSQRSQQQSSQTQEEEQPSEESAAPKSYAELGPDDVMETATGIVEAIENVPKEAVGFVIGKSGTTIKEMMLRSGATIKVERPPLIYEPQSLPPPSTIVTPQQEQEEASQQVEQQPPPQPAYPYGAPPNGGVFAQEEDGNMRKFVICGDRRAVETARGLIREKVRGRLAVDRGGIGMIGGNGRGHLEEMWVPAGRVGMLIGAGGSSIRMLEDESRTTIVVHNDKINERNEKLVMVSGVDMESVSRAVVLIKDALERPRASGAPWYEGGPGARNRLPPPPQWYGGASVGNTWTGMQGFAYGPGVVIKSVSVPSTCVGMVIGKGGQTIRDLQGRSKAVIRVTKDDEAMPGALERPIEIKGTKEAVELAHQLLNDIVNEGLKRNARDGRENIVLTQAQPTHDTPDSLRRIPDPVANERPENISVPITEDGRTYPSNSISMPLSIPNDRVGVVIGKRGATIRELQYQSGARIVVSKDPISSQDPQHMRTLTITGPRKFVEHARELILNRINDVNFRRTFTPPFYRGPTSGPGPAPAPGLPPGPPQGSALGVGPRPGPGSGGRPDFVETHNRQGDRRPMGLMSGPPSPYSYSFPTDPRQPTSPIQHHSPQPPPPPLVPPPPPAPHYYDPHPPTYAYDQYGPEARARFAEQQQLYFQQYIQPGILNRMGQQQQQYPEGGQQGEGNRTYEQQRNDGSGNGDAGRQKHMQQQELHHVSQHQQGTEQGRLAQGNPQSHHQSVQQQYPPSTTTAYQQHHQQSESQDQYQRERSSHQSVLPNIPQQSWPTASPTDRYTNNAYRDKDTNYRPQTIGRMGGGVEQPEAGATRSFTQNQGNNGLLGLAGTKNGEGQARRGER